MGGVKEPTNAQYEISSSETENGRKFDKGVHQKARNTVNH